MNDEQMTMSDTGAAEILAKLRGVRPRNKAQTKWFALCPVHEEKTPSLSITELSDGRVLMYCFGCGAGFEQIIEAIGLRKHWGFPDTAPTRLTSNHFQVREVIRAFEVELQIASHLCSNIAAGRVFNKHDRARALQCAKRLAAIMMELRE